MEVDLHTHSLFSHCGTHTYIEILTRAKELKMKAVAITDHGAALNSKIPETFFNRTCNPIPGIHLLKGIECNVLDENGCIDIPKAYLTYLDVVLVGFHHNTPVGLGAAKYTEMMIAAIKANSCIDIISHPNDSVYEIEFEPLAQLAKENGVAIEVNNSKTKLKRVDDSVTKRLIQVCKETRTLIVVNSDMHTMEELGLNSSVHPFLNDVSFPEDLIVNRSYASTIEYLSKRKQRKLKC